MSNDTTGYPVEGAGLGLRRGLIPLLREAEPGAIDFMEIAPENWIGVGGRYGRQFDWFAERYPMVCHGLSLSIGSPAPLDVSLLERIKVFMRERQIRCYTEHLSYCSDFGHLYDLMPIPFTDEAVRYVAGRIKQAQDILECRIGMEHVSYYGAPGQQLSEIDFINAVLREADCGLLLDVNNIYVNSINHHYDAAAFLDALPGERIMYVHVAGHYDETAHLKVDTHGSAVIAPVWSLLERAYQRFGVMPTLLERDFNFPPLRELTGEVAYVRDMQRRAHMDVHATAG